MSRKSHKTYFSKEHDDVIKWNIFRVTGPLCGEFTGHRWIPLTKASDVELSCFLWSALWINSWVNTREAGDLRRHRAHYGVIVMRPVLESWIMVYGYQHWFKSWLGAWSAPSPDLNQRWLLHCRHHCCIIIDNFRFPCYVCYFMV